MTAAADCLSSDDLRELTSDKLTADNLVRAEAHLAACERCVGRLSQLVDADRLAPLLRAAVASPVFLDSQAGELARDIAAGLETRIAAGDATRIDPALNAEFDLSWDEPDEIELLPPTIGPFRIIRCLGHGGMGAVFEAEDQRLMRRVALKVILPRLAADPSLRDRFLREARSIAAIRHPSIVGIYEVGSDADVPFLAMELLTGRTLEALLAKSPRLTAEQVATIGAECAAGLAAVHEKGLLHRDIKPGNIWVESFVEENGTTAARIKLLDFGLARPVQDSDGLTRPGVVIGTPRYLSPEQARGDVLDLRSDLFSLGCVLYQMTTGVVPFDGPDVLSRLNALATTVPPRADALNPKVSAELADLIERLLARNAAQRPDSAHAVADELRRIATRLRPLPPRPDPQPIPGGSESGRARRSLSAWLTGGFAVAALLAVVIIKFQDGSTVEVHSEKEVESVTMRNPGQPAVNAVPSPSPVSEQSPAAVVAASPDISIHSLDHLDPALIPVSERIAEQPPELVAVLGTQSLRQWAGIRGLAYDETGRNLLAVEPANLPPHGWSTETFTPAAIFPAHDPGGEYPTFSRDGRHAFTVDRLWHAADTGDAQTRFVRSESFPDVNPLCGDFSPDGRWIVTAADGGSHLQLWDVTADALRAIDVAPLLEGSLVDRQLTVVDSPPRIVISIFSGGNGTTEVYDVDWSASPIPKVSEPVRYAHKTYFARSAPRAVEMRSNGAFQLLDLSGHEPRPITELLPARWQAGAGTVLGDISADGRLVVAPISSVVPVFREVDGEWRQTDTLQHYSNITSVRLSPDGTQLAVAEGDNHIQLWDVSRTPAVALQTAPVATRTDRLTISPDGRYLGVAGYDGRAVYDLTSELPRQMDGLTASERQTGQWAFNVEPALAAFTGGAVQDLRETPAAPISRSLPMKEVAFVPGRSEMLLWNSPTGDVQFEWTPWHIDQRGTLLWDAARETASIPPQFIDPSDIRWERSRFLTTEGSTGVLRVYDFAHTDAPVATLLGRPHQHRWQCLSPSGDLVLQWMIAPDAIVWDLTTTPPTEYRVPLSSSAGAFMPNEKHIVLEDQYGGVVVYDWKLNREAHRIPMPGPVRSFHTHPDGRHMLSVNGNGTVYVLRLPDDFTRPPTAPQ